MLPPHDPYQFWHHLNSAHRMCALFDPALKGCFRALEHRGLKMAEQVEALYRLSPASSRPERSESPP
jgi:hypothetical protein